MKFHLVLSYLIFHWNKKHLFLILNNEQILSKNIPTAVYYPIPLNEHKPYEKYPVSHEGLSNTIYLSKNVLSLPMHPYLSESDIILIVKSIAQAIKN